MNPPVRLPVRLGMLTPSSNTTLEPVTAAMLADLPDVTAHFGRFKVTEIAVCRRADSNSTTGEILRAAELLAHAKVDVVAWNGTSAAGSASTATSSWCARLTGATGVQGLHLRSGLPRDLRAHRPKRIGLVTPYTDDVQTTIAPAGARPVSRALRSGTCASATTSRSPLVAESELAERMVREVAAQASTPS